MSLSLRLLLAAAITTTLALVATVFVFNFLFRVYFEEQARDELETYLLLLTGNIGVSAVGEVEVTPISDSRFNQALSGYYWQIQVDDEDPVLSPSFWAAPLELDRPVAPGIVSFTNVIMGTGAAVAVANWVITIGEGDMQREVFLAIAIDREDLDVSVSGFFKNSVIWLAILGLFLFVASWVQVKLGLNPLNKIRSEIARVGKSPEVRLSSDYPSEVLPLIEEVNQLLDANAEALKRARSRAGDLAHGLKTPLTILLGVERKLRRGGNAALADDLMSEITSIQHTVERELAHSRDSHQILRRCAVHPIATRLHRALSRQPGTEHLQWDIEVPETLHIPFDEFDLTELLGNLLDNAMKWSESRISINAGLDGSHGFLSVDDDGPGIPDTAISTVLKRGGRLDAQVPGAGLGLAIVSDMAHAHGCTLSLQRSSLGGLSARITWVVSGA
ncbi:HAMP domain-containing sensor histidine kinase [uncultured Aliiroseovarius sp.]|nr:HAMP domain-containing sensor histidine kinase [uncultured Aliiroseovarius sp.]